MSRKRKRRVPLGDTPQGSEASKDKVSDNDDLGIEIVDDVGVLDSLSVGPPPLPSQKLVAKSSEAKAPVVSDVPAAEPVANASVHVVEPLHVSPNEEPSGDRNVETLGELLQHAREAKGLSLEEVGARTRIALITLRHLENDRFGELPAEAYVKGFLRSYGLFLGLDVSMLLRRYEKLSGRVSTPVAEIWDEVEVRERRVKVWTPSRRTIALVTGALVVVALAWVFWSQGAVMLGLRPEGELQQIEMELQREALEGESQRAPVTGLDGAELQQEAAVVEESAKEQTAPPKPTANVDGPKRPVATEDTAPPLPVGPEQPAPQVKKTPQPKSPAVTPKPVVKKAAPKKAVPKPPKKTVAKKKPAPTPSPEDAAGPPG